MPATSAENLLLLSRNPVFTAAKSVWGYEIQATSGTAPGPGDLDVGAAVISGDYVGLKTILSRSKKMLLAYSAEQLAHHVPRALPPHCSVILVTPACQQDPALLPALRLMASEGHTVALEWNQRVTPSAPALDVASMLCLAAPEMAADPVLQDVLVRGADPAAGGPAKTCLVRGVARRCELENLLALGITLFQGRFFKTAEIIPGRRLSSHQNSRLQLLRVIEGDDPDLDALARTIQSDVTLSYRLLTYLNSPAFGFMRKIDSIRQAITLLGWINVRNWLRAVLLADMTQGELQGELLHLSLWRGRFLEQLVARNDYWDFRPDEMFLIGMFSLLDAILGVPMAEALACLPLTEAQKKALADTGPTEYAPLLYLMAAFEDSDRAAQDRAMQDLSLDPDAARRLHIEAGAWAAAILEVGGKE
jgi:EAL and modified HD-GYP domain-containing signal transduction protein